VQRLKSERGYFESGFEGWNLSSLRCLLFWSSSSTHLPNQPPTSLQYKQGLGWEGGGMWIRKRLDIDWQGLAFAIGQALWPRAATVEERLWLLFGNDTIACLSVRSAWDLLLQSLALPPGSEVLTSAITVPDMAAIARHHQLRVTPVDLDPETAAPCLKSLARACSTRSRILLVAHLFGSRFAIERYAEFAKEQGLLLVEDCAQAYAGPEFRGHNAATATLFSFGPIKAATALGGAIAVVRNESLLDSMHKRQSQYPLQSRWSFFQRTFKYAAFRGLSSRAIYGAIFAACRLVGKDPDRLINGAVRNFSGGELLGQLRKRPSTSLLALLARQISGTGSKWRQKAERGRELRAILADSIPCPGADVKPHTYWVFPVRSANPLALVAALGKCGFDATQGQSLAVVDFPEDRPDLEPLGARELLRQIVFLPLHAEMGTNTLHQMARIVVEVEPRKQIHLPVTSSLFATAAAGNH
jgi:perosamine synthetase